MYLAIYRKKKKMYFNVVKSLSEVIHITNENMETVTLTHRDKIASYRFRGWNDLKKLRSTLLKWGLRYIILKNEFHEVTQVKLVIMLMNNPLIDVVIGEEKILSEKVAENQVDSKMYELLQPVDVEYAHEAFGCFNPEDFPDIF